MFHKKLPVIRKCMRFASIYSAETLLSDFSRKNCVRKFQAVVPRKLKGYEEKRSAAVLIPLCIHNDDVSLLYTLRTCDLTTHRGQVSFPGGMQDQNDKNLAETALRETQEELGIHPNDVVIWGKGMIYFYLFKCQNLIFNILYSPHSIVLFNILNRILFLLHRIKSEYRKKPMSHILLKKKINQTGKIFCR